MSAFIKCFHSLQRCGISVSPRLLYSCQARSESVYGKVELRMTMSSLHSKGGNVSCDQSVPVYKHGFVNLIASYCVLLELQSLNREADRRV